MIVRTQGGDRIVNTDKAESIYYTEDDSGIYAIIADMSGTPGHKIILGRYGDEELCAEVLSQLFHSEDRYALPHDDAVDRIDMIQEVCGLPFETLSGFLSTRAYNCMAGKQNKFGAKYTTVGDFLNADETELKDIQGLGDLSLADIRAKQREIVKHPAILLNKHEKQLTELTELTDLTLTGGSSLW